MHILLHIVHGSVTLYIHNEGLLICWLQKAACHACISTKCTFLLPSFDFFPMHLCTMKFNIASLHRLQEFVTAGCKPAENFYEICPLDVIGSFSTAVSGGTQVGNTVHRSRHQQQQLLHPSSAATAPVAVQAAAAADFQPPYFPPPYAPMPQTPSAMAAAIPSGIVEMQRHFSAAAAAAAGGTDPYSYAAAASGNSMSQHTYLSSGRQSLPQVFDFDGFHREFVSSGASGGGNCSSYDAVAAASSSSDGSRCVARTNGGGVADYPYSVATFGGRSVAMCEATAFGGNGHTVTLGGNLSGGSCVTDPVAAINGTSLHEIQLNDDLAAQVLRCISYHDFMWELMLY